MRIKSATPGYEMVNDKENPKKKTLNYHKLSPNLLDMKK
jgi:hypothetical protein